MKKLLFPVLAVALLVVAGGVGWWYYYSHVQEVREYYLIRYKPPVAAVGVFASSEMTKPEIEVENLSGYKYENDSLAIEHQEDLFSQERESLLKMYDDEIVNAEKPSTEAALVGFNAKKAAYDKLLAEERNLFCITHVRSFEPSELFEVVKEYGLFSEEVEKFIEENHLDVGIYDVNAIKLQE